MRYVGSGPGGVDARRIPRDGEDVGRDDDLARDGGAARRRQLEREADSEEAIDRHDGDENGAQVRRRLEHGGQVPAKVGASVNEVSEEWKPGSWRKVFVGPGFYAIAFAQPQNNPSIAASDTNWFTWKRIHDICEAITEKPGLRRHRFETPHGKTVVTFIVIHFCGDDNVVCSEAFFSRNKRIVVTLTEKLCCLFVVCSGASEYCAQYPQIPPELTAETFSTRTRAGRLADNSSFCS